MRITNYQEQIAGAGKIILFCEPDQRIAEAVTLLRDEGVITPKLVGDWHEYLKFSDVHNIESFPIEPERFLEEYMEMRKHKEITKEKAMEELKDPALFACMLVKNGLADGLVCGASWPTSQTLKAAFKTLSQGIVFSYFIMREAQGDYLFADCAVNMNPTSEELAEMAIAVGQEAEWLRLKPKIALLSFSTHGSAHHADQEKVAKAADLAKKKLKELGKEWLLDGEMQVDAAMDKAVAERKSPNSAIKGDANVFIFPDLNAGNIGYKLVQRFTHSEAIGPILAGLAKPVNDLSRGCSVQEVVDTAYITAWQSLHLE